MPIISESSPLKINAITSSKYICHLITNASITQLLFNYFQPYVAYNHIISYIFFMYHIKIRPFTFERFMQKFNNKFILYYSLQNGAKPSIRWQDPTVQDRVPNCNRPITSSPRIKPPIQNEASPKMRERDERENLLSVEKLVMGTRRRRCHPQRV